jgi:phage terminase large subunit-like protein
VAALTGAIERPDWLRAVEGDDEYRWAILAWDRAAGAEGAWFDHAKADAVVALWPQVFTLTVDRFAGVPFRLNTWQDIIVRMLVGWKVPVDIIDPLTGEPALAHVRLFRCLRLWVPRKNGKSEFLAALALLFWALEGVVAGEGYCFGRDETQGKIILARMKAMIANAPELARSIQTYGKSLYLKQYASPFVVLSGSEEGKHGKSPTVIAGDEMHEWRSREVENTLRQGTGGRLQPIELYASTAGLKTNATGVELWDESLAVLEGRIDDPTTLIVVFAADQEADFNDEGQWRKANPSLGLSPTIAYLRREAGFAKGNPRAEAHFRRYHLNQWVESTARWINLKRWDACAADKDAWRHRLERMRGRRVFGSFDVSSTKDVTALLWHAVPEEPGQKWEVAARFWVPEETLAERVKADRVPYDKYLAAGALETTPGDYVDQSFVMNALLEGFDMFDVQLVGFDPWNARKLVTDLQKQGVEAEQMVEIRQGILSLGEPSKQFERLVYAGQYDHGGHPMLRWMAGNVVVRFDENMNFMPAKKRSAEKIDGIVAGVMGVGVAMADIDIDDAEPGVVLL